MADKTIHISAAEFRRLKQGGVAEGFKAPVSKTDKQETVSQVQILPPPNPIACILDAEPKPKKSKYWNVRTEYNGRKYPSSLQAKAARDLDLLKSSGQILSYNEEVTFRLPGGVIYRLDFLVFLKNDYSNLGRPEVMLIEIKALDKKTSEFRMTQSGRDKIKQVEALYKIQVEITDKISPLF